MALTTAVIGGGTVSDRHLNGLTRLPSADLVAVCDLDEERVREKAREYDLTAYTDAEAMLVREDLDWVHLCTPVQSHLELARLAIETGIPVQIEKPVTESAEEARELAELAEDRGVPVSVVHNHNFAPAVRRARDAVERGVIGDVRSVDVLYAGETWPDEEKRGSWVQGLPGGEFEEGLPHPIYLLLNLGGYPADEGAIDAGSASHRTYEEFDYDGLQFQYTSDAGTLCSATIVASEVPHKVIQIHGDRGSIVVDVVSQTVTTLDRDYEASPVARAMTNVDRVADRVRGSVQNLRAMVRRKRGDDWAAERDMVAHYYQFDREAEALRRGDPVPVPLAEGRWTIEIMEEIRDSAADPPEAAPRATAEQD